ncbi:MAG: flavin reductase family protein [Candidatus Aminicenantes bacterium]|nr:flavin reductase family protein [Candidatus Aminicenantes bacterium]
MKKITTNLDNFQYFYPYTVNIVGAQSGDQINYMACAWHTALSFDPPLFGVLISKKRRTHQVISQAREFTVNFIGFEQVKLSAQMGRISGHDRDKIKELQVELAPAVKIHSPILAQAYACLENRLVDIRPYGDHDLFVGEVLAVHEEEGCFDQNGALEVEKIHPLLYLGSDLYITIAPDSLKKVLPD